VTPFLLLGSFRTGSTLVANSLVEHPEILFYGEVFHNVLHRRKAEAARETLGHGVLRRLPLGLPLCRNDDDGFDYLARLFSRGSRFGATGFKLFYDHAGSGPVSAAWEYVASDRRIRIIHLFRDNWLESLVSHERAMLTGVWHSPNPPSAGSFRLSPEKCRAHFARLEELGPRVQPILDTHPVFGLEYRQLVGDFQQSMVRLCSFLQVSSDREFVPRFAKLARKEPRYELANYEELQVCFRGTPYARFFP
jgi:hypothetical protein